MKVKTLNKLKSNNSDVIIKDEIFGIDPNKDVILSFAFCQLVFHSFWCALGAYLGKSFIYNQRISKLVIIFTVLVVLVTLFYAPLA